MKTVCFFIISGGNEEQKTWVDLEDACRQRIRKIKSIYSSQFMFYLLKSNPQLDKTVIDEEDGVIYCPGHESKTPGIFNKTIEAFRVAPKADYYIRTNLSSFYIFSTLQETLPSLPTTNLYGGVCTDTFVSGCGFILTPDVMQTIVDNVQHCEPHLHSDDVALGQIVMHCGIPFTPIPRFNYTGNLDQLLNAARSKQYFHLRLKQNCDNRDAEVQLYYSLNELFC